METVTTLLYSLAGLLLRLALPITATMLVIFILRKLDKRWQSEAGLQSIPTENPACWKIKSCTPEQIKNCGAIISPLPCWQLKRQPNGYLNEKCLTCLVFVEAPIPTVSIEPRRM